MTTILRQIGFIFAILIVLIVLWCWHMMSLPPDIPIINYQDAKFKTGDMILFHAYDNINPIFIGTFWGHVGIVFVDPDKPGSRPIMFEATRINPNENCVSHNKSGIVISDLQSRIEKYKGIVVHKPLDKTLDSDISRGFTKFMAFAKQNMFYDEDVIYSGVRNLMGDPLNFGTNCGEITTMCLVKLGLLPPETIERNIAHHLRYVVSLKTLHNNKYNGRQRLRCDRF
jgi:hypothetical protein